MKHNFALEKVSLHKEYVVALFIAPVVCLIYLSFLGEENKGIQPDYITLLMLVVVYPILEELVFRGLIQEYIFTKIKGFWISNLSKANVITSIFFVLLHTAYNPLWWALLVFFPSLVFGYFKEKYDSLFPSIFLHISYNTWFFVWIGKV